MSKSNLYQTEGRMYPDLGNQKQGLEQIDINLVQKAISDAEQIINKQTSAQHIVLFWGFSGAGKSSTVVLLSGQQVLGYHNPSPILVEKNPSNDKKGVRIQVKVHSGTIYPAVLQLKYESGNKGRVMLWDMPGLGESRGITQSIINSYFIHRIFSFHKQVKLIFTFDFVNIDPSRKALNFQKNLQDLTTILGHFDSYLQGIALMITKVPQHGNQEVVLQCLKGILMLSSFKDNPSYNKFLSNVISKKIPLILVKVPDLRPNFVKEQNAKDVTNQYTNLIEQTYNIVTSRIKSVSFPQLNSAAMSAKQLAKCKPFVQNTNNSIQKQMNTIKQNLKDFVIYPYKQVQFSQNLTKVQGALTACKEMNIFIDKIIEIVQKEKQNRSKIQMKDRFDNLKKLFQIAKFQCSTKKQGINQCIPMMILNNQYIMIKFLNSLLKNNSQIILRWKDQKDILEELFKRIELLKLKDVWDEQEKAVNLALKNYIRLYFQKQFVQLIDKQWFYQLWSEQYKIFPSFLLSTTKFDTNKNSTLYFQELMDKSMKLKIKANQKLKTIINLLELNKRSLSKQPDQNFIKNDIKSLLQAKGNQLIERAASQMISQQQAQKAIQKYSRSVQTQVGKNSQYQNQQLIQKVQDLEDKNRQLSKKVQRMSNAQKGCCFCCFIPGKKGQLDNYD